MRDPRINFRSRELAALLAFLVPGAGHFYQGRMLKAKIYFFGILSLFFGGMVLGDWQPIYFSSSSYPAEMMTETQVRDFEFRQWQSRRRFIPTMGYPTQFFLGAAAMPAIIQRVRHESDPGLVEAIDSAIESEFSGAFEDGSRQVFVEGRIRLTPEGGSAVAGEFTGTTNNGENVSLALQGSIRLGREVFGSPRRQMEINGLRDTKIGDFAPSRLVGKIQRSFFNWYQAPPDNNELDRLHGKLSQNFDIACVFTWIAGLLNLMAIWDAYDGPAYGYGDEDPEEEEDSNKNGNEG